MSTKPSARTRGCKVQVPSTLPAEAADRLAALFKAASDPTRVQMLHMLREAKEPICVCDFTQVFALSQPTVSHHLARLRDAGLVSAERDGVWTYYSMRKDLPEESLALIAALQA